MKTLHYNSYENQPEIDNYDFDMDNRNARVEEEQDTDGYNFYPDGAF